ncbi:MAG: rhodanese-like domain-containing protein [Pirellulaceae bacterium]
MSDELPIEIDVQTLAAMQNSGDDFVLLDVREADEYAIAKIDGSILLPMSELRDRVSELDEHRQRNIVVHCHHGGRSMRVTLALKQMGFTQVQNLAGGIDLWSQEIDTNVPRY